MRWNDEYWPLLLQIYKKKPQGVKPLYSREVIDVALRLHIHPKEIVKRLQKLEKIDTPSLQKMYDNLKNPKKLNAIVQTLIKNEGFGTSGDFYKGIEKNESWETDFRPLEAEPRLKPINLIFILNLYFYLTPTTMVAETEEIKDLARQMDIPAELIVHVLEVYKFCDPYLNNSDIMIDPLLFPCKDMWNRYVNGSPGELERAVSELEVYFK